MNAADHPVWFVGDLDDPWVASLADALPAGVRRIACAGDLPDDWPGDDAGTATAAAGPRVVVVHRAWLSPHDAERLARLRTSSAGEAPAPRVILCVGPNVRHADLERWSARGMIDAVVPEATARDTIARHLVAGEVDGVPRRPALPRPRVAVVECQFRAQAHPGRCLRGARLSRRAGVRLVGGRGDRPGDLGRARARARLAARPGPPHAARCGGRPVLDSPAGHSSARPAAQGASACLELPYDLLDLGHVLARVTAPLGEPAHAVPPRPASCAAPGVGRCQEEPEPRPAAGGRPGPGCLE